MSTRSIPFDAVLFDLDGTLVATEQFWPQAARAGAQRALAELGLTRELPSAAQWMGLVGQRLEDGFLELFPDLTAAARQHLLTSCVAEEQRAIQTGGVAFLPGVESAAPSSSPLSPSNTSSAASRRLAPPRTASHRLARITRITASPRTTCNRASSVGATPANPTAPPLTSAPKAPAARTRAATTWANAP